MEKELMSLTVEPIEILVQNREIGGFFWVKHYFAWKETEDLYYINSKALCVMKTFLSARNTVNKISEKMLHPFFILFYSNLFNLNMKQLLMLCTYNR